MDNRPATGYLRKQVILNGMVWRLEIRKTGIRTGELVIRGTNDGDLFLSIKGDGENPLTEG